MPRRLAASVLLAIFLSAAPGVGNAQEAATAGNAFEKAPASLEEGIKALGDKGVLFGFNYWGEGFANLSGGVRRGGDYDGLLKLSVTLDLDKLAHWQGATLFASILYPHGNGISDRYVHDYNLLSNIDAYDTVRLSELWLKQTFFDGRFSIRVGNLVTDNDFYISNNGALFFNSDFAVIGTVDHDLAPPIYPVASSGVMVRDDLTPSIYLEATAVDDNPGSQSIDDKHGTRFGINAGHGVLAFYEAGFIPHPPGGSSPLQADYKLGGFIDSQFHPDVSNSSSGHGDYGFYAITDQPLYVVPGSPADAPRGLSGFARVSYAPDQRNPVVYYFDTGFNYTGLLPERPADVLGAAFSFERLGTDVSLASGAPVLSHHEHVIEVTYLANLTDYFSLQPDVQYIINPGGFGKTPNALVAGVRFNLTF